MLVSACADGSVLLWHLKTGKELRRLTCSKQMQHQHPMNLGDFKNNSQIMRITGVRFLPKNSNLVACATSGGLIRLLNVSTGKFLLEGSGHTTGKPSCIEIDPRTGASHQSLLWSGSDRGYIESFRYKKVVKDISIIFQNFSYFRNVLFVILNKLVLIKAS